MHNKDLEKYSSAVTLSDMEIFIFPELLYSLFLANIMSPIIWEWKKDPWFKDIEKMTPYRRILRVKQYIMDKYDFNLDLETWGLTTQEEEIDRFKTYIDEDTLSKSNALFGYEGDKYYFKLDIRKHFGIDKYDSNVIPYWKTETIEAMDAYKYKDAYETGAGECVSLSTLYAAAIFIICKIPLESIYLLATPLHSQNFIDIKDGLLTNNRRIVTKNMWFNGTEITAKAQRALRNEQVTIVSHNSGFVHTVYPEATMDINEYNRFEKKLKKFLITEINSDILCNFLRQESQYQKCFQIKHDYHDRERYIGAERAYAYEHNSAFKVNESTIDKLLSEIDEYEFSAEPLEDRICLNKFNDVIKTLKINLQDKDSLTKLIDEMDCSHIKKSEILNSFFEFCYMEPRLPGGGKKFITTEAIKISNNMERDEIISHLETIRDKNITVDLAFYAYRDFLETQWEPFIKAAMERNPVLRDACKEYSDDEVIKIFGDMPNESIYDGPRMAQPDEVWNYQRGDGFERAICLASILKIRDKQKVINIFVNNDQVIISIDNTEIAWPSKKGLVGKIRLEGDGKISISKQ